jgi:hypothetical protein
MYADSQLTLKATSSAGFLIGEPELRREGSAPLAIQ